MEATMQQAMAVKGQGFSNLDMTRESDEPDDRCTSPDGHEWNVPDSERDRSYCLNCGADGDA